MLNTKLPGRCAIPAMFISTLNAAGVCLTIASFRRNFFIVKVENFFADDLIIFVSLACNEYEVAGACLTNRAMNGCAPVFYFFVRLGSGAHTFFDIIEDSLRVFCARIVGRKNHYVAQACGRFAHRRAFAAVAVAAATKDCDDPLRCHVARCA